MATSSKRCPDCGAVKPHSGFYRNKARPDGVTSVCKKCHSTRTNEWRRENPKSASTISLRSNLVQRQSTAGKVKHLARVATKKLQRRPCEVCGSEVNVHAHHDDYGRPLDVRWLCRQHHEEWHRHNTAVTPPFNVLANKRRYSGYV